MGKFLKEGALSYLNRALNLKLVPLVVPHFSHREKNDAPQHAQGIKCAFSAAFDALSFSSRTIIISERRAPLSFVVPLVIIVCTC